jgi:steroid delta-isomerase-like uncharacterized protein
VDASFAEDFAFRWQDAVNRQAIDEIIAFCAEDIRFTDPSLAEPGTGRTALRPFFEGLWRAIPDLRFTRPDPPYLFLAADGEAAVVRWVAAGTMTGRFDPPGYAPTNGAVRFHGVDIWRFEDGLLSEWEGIYDMIEIGRQVGALPPAGSRGERLGVLLQRLGARRMRRAAKS